MQRPGYTLLELALILALVAMLLTIATPAFVHARAVIAVRGARSDLIAAIAGTRTHAILTGGAQLVIQPTGALHIERADGVPLGDAVDLAQRYGVTLVTARNEPVVLRYDGLGIGRLTNATIQLRRAGVLASVVVSAYGRAR